MTSLQPPVPKVSTSRADISVRAAVDSDIDSFPEMKVRTWRETYIVFGVPLWFLDEPPLEDGFREGFPDRIADPTRRTWIAYDEVEKKVVGYATALSKPNLHGYIDIRALYVLTEYQGMGLGKRLIEGVVGEKDCRAVVGTLLANNSARGFYQKMGFTRLVVSSSSSSSSGTLQT